MYNIFFFKRKLKIYFPIYIYIFLNPIELLLFDIFVIDLFEICIFY